MRQPIFIFPRKTRILYHFLEANRIALPEKSEEKLFFLSKYKRSFLHISQKNGIMLLRRLEASTEKVKF